MEGLHALSAQVRCPARRATALILACLAREGMAAAPDADAAAGAGYDEVLVTAGKLTEPLQRTALSLRVVDAEVLERAGILDFEDLAQVVPSLTISKTTQPANNSLNLRGIGTYAFSIAVEPGVSVVVDDIPQAFQAAAFTSLVDVQQVEVLRGPQNTLFGKSSSAGVIRIATSPVSPTFTGRVSALLTDDHEQRVLATASGPVTRDIGFRVSANYSDYRGALHNLTTDRWVNGQSDLNFRGRLEWHPADAWTVAISPFWSRTEGSCCAAAETFVAAGSTTGSAATGRSRIPAAVFLGGIVPSPGNRQLRMDVDPRGDSRHAGTGLRIERDAGRFTLLSLTSYEDYELTDRQDTDSTDIDFSRYQPVSPAGGSANGGSFKVTSRTQEFRLSSVDPSRARFVAGTFWSSLRSQRRFVRGSNALDDYRADTPPGILVRPVVPANLPTTNDTAFSRYLADATSDTVALFGQATVALSPTLDLLAGLRGNRERIAYRFVDDVNGVTYGSPRCASGTPSGLSIRTCDRDDAVTGRAGLRFQPAPSFMAFATYSRGRKAMAYDLSSTLTQRGPAPATSPRAGWPLADVVAANQPVPEETVDNHEVGFKGTFLGGRARLNTTAYYMKYANLQAQSRDLLLNQNVLNSVGRVTSAGVEVEAAAQVGRLTLDAAGAYNRARIDEFPNASCYRGQTVAEGCVSGVQDLAGRTLPNAPRWSLSAVGEYRRPVRGRLETFAHAAWRWQSAVVHSLLQDPASRQPDYDVLNLGAGLRTRDLRVTAFVNNVFDRRFLLNGGRDTHINNPPGVFATNWRPAREAQRTAGLRVTVEF